MMLPPRPPLIHVAQAGPGGQKGAIEVDGEHLFPFGIAEFVDRVHDLDAGIADQDVDAPQLRHAAGHAGDRPRLVRHIHRNAERLAAGRADFFGGAFAASRFRSAIATRAPSRANIKAISLPMPLAAPVTMADYPCSHIVACLLNSFAEIVVDDGSKPGHQVGLDVHTGNHFQHRERRNRRKRMMEEFERGRALPCALDGDVFAEILHQFADARALPSTCGMIFNRKLGAESEAQYLVVIERSVLEIPLTQQQPGPVRI